MMKKKNEKPQMMKMYAYAWFNDEMGGHEDDEEDDDMNEAIEKRLKLLMFQNTLMHS